jgi:2-dehydro-3-deoxyphosphogluconate aldolase / (4S)-4-hydroxy-2-oxoglutarate aldolase
MPKDQTLQQLFDEFVVAVIRAGSADQLGEIVEALVTGGVRSIEVTMTTPGAVDGVRALSKRFGERITLGVGSVMTVSQARDAIAAGARFVVSPMFDEHVVKVANNLGVVSIPGAYTPTEIIRANAGGADVVKVFPATALGPGYIRDVLAPLPGLCLMPTGGVTVENGGQWRKAGAVAAGAGNALVPKHALDTQDWPALTARAAAFVQAVQKARGT